MLYKVPEPKKPKKGEATECCSLPDSRPAVYLPVSPEILRSLKVAQNIEITLSGTVKALEYNESDYNKRCEIRLELSTVELDDREPDSADAKEFSNLAD